MAGSNFLLTMKLVRQGTVIGSSKKKEGDLDYSKGMECHGFAYPVLTQIDPSSGPPTGKRKHSPIVIRREVDAASPKLLQALATNEGFKTATLSFNRIGPDGKPVLARTIELTNGVIVHYAIRPAKDSGGKRYQDVTLAYEGLLVNGIPDGIIQHSYLP